MSEVDSTVWRISLRAESVANQEKRFVCAENVHILKETMTQKYQQSTHEHITSAVDKLQQENFHNLKGDHDPEVSTGTREHISSAVDQLQQEYSMDSLFGFSNKK